MLLDLHMHSTSSDGQYSPSELVNISKEKMLEVMALTDHDTVAGIAEARAEATRIGMPFIGGIEISSMEFEEVHIVGLGIDENNKRLIDITTKMMEDRADRGIKIKNYLATRAVELDLAEVYELAGEGSIGRPHFAEYLKRHGYVTTIQGAFDRYLDTPAFHEATDRVLPTTKEAIELIHQAGGIAILAHPGLLKKGKARQEEFISQLITDGIDGIEVFYSKHSFPQTKYYAEIAEKNNLLMSAGSDFHGEKIKPSVKLGMQVNKKYYRFLPQNVVL